MELEVGHEADDPVGTVVEHCAETELAVRQEPQTAGSLDFEPQAVRHLVGGRPVAKYLAVAC